MDNPWTSESILVIGGNGYLGVEIIKRLLQEGAMVTSIDIDKAMNTNIEGISKDFKYVPQDLTNFEQLSKILKKSKFKICFYLAGFSGVAKAKENPLEAFANNTQIVCNLLEAFRRSDNFPHTVVASSNHIYGKQFKYPTPEDASLNNLDIYGATIGCGDVLARAYATTYNVPVSIARITNTYGGREPFKNHLIPHIILEVQKGTAPVIKGDGSAMKGFLYINDTINGIMILAENMKRKELWGKAFNFYPDCNMSVLDVVKTILKVMNRQDLPIKTNGDSGDESIEFLSNHLAKSKLGWKQEVSLEAGIGFSITDYKRYEARI